MPTVEIKQTHYAQIELDGSEKDCLIIVGTEKRSCNVIHIENENLEALVNIIKQLKPEYFK